jgi:hypothetical protein
MSAHAKAPKENFRRWSRQCRAIRFGGCWKSKIGFFGVATPESKAESYATPDFAPKGAGQWDGNSTSDDGKRAFIGDWRPSNLYRRVYSI